MALELKNYGAWVLNPYCFCEQRPWLTINDLNYIDADGNATTGGVLTGDGGGVATLPNLSDEDTALLAALLTALAVFLFLLFLLLCLLCPLGVCCGKKGICCGGSEKDANSSKSRSAGGKSGSESGSVTLTAVDMKIPRPWAETGFSDSELDKRQSKEKWMSAWDDGAGDSAYWWGTGGKHGMVNSGYHGDEFQDGRWFSTNDLDSIYGGKGHRGWQDGGEMIAMDEFYRGSVRKGGSDVTRIRHNSYSDVENLMTSPQRDLSLHSNLDVYSSHAGSGYHGDRGRTMEAMTVTKQEMTKSVASEKSGFSPGSNNMNAVAEISLQDARSRDLVPIQAPPPYNQSQVTSASLTSADFTSADDFRNSTLPVGEIISTTYSRAYREVVEETTTE